MLWWIGLTAVVYCASYVLAGSDTETYTILHRFVRTDDDKEQASPWFPRTFTEIPITPEGAPLSKIESVTSNLEFPEQYAHVMYQVKMVPGDTRTFSEKEKRKWIEADQGFLSSVKLVRIIPNLHSANYLCLRTSLSCWMPSKCICRTLLHTTLRRPTLRPCSTLLNRMSNTTQTLALYLTRMCTLYWPAISAQICAL